MRGLIVFGLAAFLLARYIPMALDAANGEGLSAEALEGLTMFWSIVLLDLGMVLPATIALGLGLMAGTDWGRRAMYALVGWWAFVPASVAAMAVVMVVNDDPHSAVGQAVVFVAAAALFAAFAARVYRPLFGREPRGEPPVRGADRPEEASLAGAR